MSSRRDSKGTKIIQRMNLELEQLSSTQQLVSLQQYQTKSAGHPHKQSLRTKNLEPKVSINPKIPLKKQPSIQPEAPQKVPQTSLDYSFSRFSKANQKPRKTQKAKPQKKRKKLVQCKICNEQFSRKKLRTFGKCDHFFCVPCLKEYLIFKIQNSIDEVRCPEEGCGIFLDEQGPMFSELGSPKLKHKNERNKIKRNLVLNKNLRECGKETCEGIIDLDNWRIQKSLFPSDPFFCPTCKTDYCGGCLDLKNNCSCDDQIAKKYENQFKYKRCAKCKIVISKDIGCKHMVCKCGYQFCYQCGRDWNGHGSQCIPLPSPPPPPPPPRNNRISYYQQIRWEINTSRLMYECGCLSFSNYLNCFSMQGRISEMRLPLRVQYWLLYVLIIYPIGLGLFMVLAMLLTIGILVVVVGFLVVLPVICIIIGQVRQFSYFKTISFIFKHCGLVGYVILTVLFYPFVMISITFEFIYYEIRWRNHINGMVRWFEQIAIGFRNIILMPLLIYLD